MKQGATLTRVIILMMLLALVAYGVAAAFSVLERSTATVTAIAYEVGDGFQATGFVVRDEQVIRAPAGINVLLRSEGERVAKGEALAATFADEGAQETQMRIDELEQELERIDKRVRALNETYNDLRGKTESARKAADEAGTAFGQALGKDLNERIERGV